MRCVICPDCVSQSVFCGITVVAASLQAHWLFVDTQQGGLTTPLANLYVLMAVCRMCL